MKYQTLICSIFSFAVIFVGAIAAAAQTASGGTELFDEAKYQQSLENQTEIELRASWQTLDQDGNAALEKSELNRAENHQMKARLVAEKLADKILEAKSLHQLGRISRARGDAANARRFYEKAEQLLRPLAETFDKQAELALGLLRQDFSNLLILEKQPIEALKASFEAWKIARAHNNEQLASASANGIGASFRVQGNIVSAVAWLERGREIAAKASNPDNYFIGDASLRLSSLYEFQGEYGLALTNLLEAEKSFATLNQPAQTARLWRRLAKFYDNHGQTDKAIQYFEKACDLSQKSGLGRQTIVCQSELGSTYFWQKRFAEAESVLTKAEAGANQLKAEDLQLTILTSKAFLFGNTSRFSESVSIFARAEQLAQSKENWTDRLRLHWLRAIVFHGQKDFKSGLADVEKAVALAEAHQETDSIPHLLELRGKILLAQGNIKEARAVLRRAIDLIEAGREQQREAATSIGFLGERSESYRILADLELRENDERAALLMSEMLKSRWLSDRAGSSNSPLSPQASWQKTADAGNLRAQILDASERFLEGASEADKALTALEKRYQDMVAANSQLSRQGRKFVGGLTKDELTSLVADEKTVVLSFAVTTDEKIAIFIITGGKVKAVLSSAKYSEVVRQIRTLRKEISTFVPGFKQTARNLYRALLSPVEKDIAAAEKLIVVPDKALWELPFQTLITDSNRYLIETHQISYVPSLHFLKTAQQIEKENPQSFKFLAFANSVNAQTTPLKHAEREATEISKLYQPGTVFVRRTASESNFKQQAAKAKLIHLAVHGDIKLDQPFASALLLTRRRRRRAVDDC